MLPCVWLSSLWIFKEVSVENELVHWSQGSMFGAVCCMAGGGCGNDVDIEDDCIVCVDSVWYFRPCFDTKDAVHRPHWKGLPSTCIAEDNWGGPTTVEAEGGYSLGAFISTEDSSFLFRKSSLLLALRRRVEGLDFFLTTCTGTGKSRYFRIRCWVKIRICQISVSIIKSILPSVSPRSVMFVFGILGMLPFKYLASRTQYIPPTLTKLTFFMIDSFIIFSALLNFKLPRKSSEVFWTPQFFWRYFATLKTAGRSKKSAATESGATFRGGEELVPK